MYVDANLTVQGGEWDRHSLCEVSREWLEKTVSSYPGGEELSQRDQDTIDAILAEMDFRGIL